MVAVAVYMRRQQKRRGDGMGDVEAEGAAGNDVDDNDEGDRVEREGDVDEVRRKWGIGAGTGGDGAATAGLGIHCGSGSPGMRYHHHQNQNQNRNIYPSSASLSDPKKHNANGWTGPYGLHSNDSYYIASAPTAPAHHTDPNNTENDQPSEKVLWRGSWGDGKWDDTSTRATLQGDEKDSNITHSAADGYNHHTHHHHRHHHHYNHGENEEGDVSISPISSPVSGGDSRMLTPASRDELENGWVLDGDGAGQHHQTLEDPDNKRREGAVDGNGHNSSGGDNDDEDDDDVVVVGVADEVAVEEVGQGVIRIHIKSSRATTTSNP